MRVAEPHSHPPAFWNQSQAEARKLHFFSNKLIKRKSDLVSHVLQ